MLKEKTDFNQVKMISYPTFAVQRALSKTFFKKNEMKEISDYTDPANTFKKNYSFKKGELNVVSNKRIQYTPEADKVLIYILSKFLKINGNHSKNDNTDFVKYKIPINVSEFALMTLDENDIKSIQAGEDKNKIKNLRKKIKTILNDLISIRYVEINNIKMTLFEDNVERKKLLDQFIVTFRKSLSDLLIKKSKHVSISYRPLSIFKLNGISYVLGSMFSSYIFMGKNIKNNRRTLMMSTIIANLDSLIPSEEKIRKMKSSYERKIMQPILSGLDDIEKNNIFSCNISHDNYLLLPLYKKSKFTYVEFINSKVDITPLDTATTYAEFQKKLTEISEIEHKETVKECRKT